MPKRAISVTLDTENITWLKGRARGSGSRSVSELLDAIVAAARAGGQVGESRSVAGTIDIAADDPLLEGAGAAVRSLFETSLGRPMRARERASTYRGQPRARKKGRG